MLKYNLYKTRIGDKVAGSYLREVIKNSCNNYFWDVYEGIKVGYNEAVLIKRVYDSEIFQELVIK